MRTTERKPRRKPKPRPSVGAATDDPFGRVLEQHARERCDDPDLVVWLLALVAGDRAELKGQD